MDNKVLRNAIKNKIRLLNEILEKHNIPKEYYSLTQYCDEAICLEKKIYWYVYHGERGNKYEIETFNNLNDACIEMIKRLSPDEKSASIMIGEYRSRFPNEEFKRYNPRRRKSLNKHKDTGHSKYIGY